MLHFLSSQSNQWEMNKIVIVFSHGNGYINQVGFFSLPSDRRSADWLIDLNLPREIVLFLIYRAEFFMSSPPLRKSFTTEVSCFSFSAKEFWGEGVKWIMQSQGHILCSGPLVITWSRASHRLAVAARRLASGGLPVFVQLARWPGWGAGCEGPRLCAFTCGPNCSPVLPSKDWESRGPLS